MKRKIVTDHAVIRWMERKMGLDIESIRDEIESHAMPAIKAGALSVVVGKVRLIFEDGHVLSVIDSRLPNGKIRERKANDRHNS